MMLRTLCKTMLLSRRTALRHAAVALVAVGVSACTSAPAPVHYPEIRFMQGQAIPVRAARVEIVSEFRPSFAAPNVEHLVPVSPERMARQWALDRLQPLRSGSAVARVTILDAQVVEAKLKTTDGIKGAFTDEPAERYDATLRVRLTLDDPSRHYRGEVETTTRRSLTVQKDATLNQREAVWYELVQKLGAEFDAAMSNNLRQYLPEAVAGN